MLEQELINIGINEKEAKIYLSTLELGQSTVQQIAQKAGVNRATAYFVIDALMQRGLISSFHKGKKQYFLGADPERLVEILEQEKESVEKKKESLKRLLPQLQSLNNKQGDRPLVRYYEGKEGIASMVDEVLKVSAGTVYMAYSVDAVNDIFNEKDLQRWRKIRVERNMQMKVIYTYKDGELHDIPNSENTKVPFDKFPITCDFAVYGNKVRIASLANRQVGIIIEDAEIAKSMEAILKLALESAKNYSETK
ncbi:MAG: helix-turn-helix domain-containing protein [Candidatus Moranbacteria bacterium]|nr:helix-turn-helix domain-containing protein [Candidatus Moranbacteria bacterium]